MSDLGGEQVAKRVFEQAVTLELTGRAGVEIGDASGVDIALELAPQEVPDQVVVAHV